VTEKFVSLEMDNAKCICSNQDELIGGKMVWKAAGSAEEGD
jgi:hypothetical protein